MGSILSSKILKDGKVVYEVLVDKEEALQLRGHVDNIHLFSDNIIDINSRISFRGKDDATKYFLIPRELRQDLTIKKDAMCQRLETKCKIIFVYIIDKFKI